MNRLTRRKFISTSCMFGLSALIKPDLAIGQIQEPLLFINLFANGGWDVASFCDPKINSGQKINNWAEVENIKQAGNLRYAPVANNAELFNRHFDKMLVLNGINAKTNVHSAGRLTSLTGYNKNGYPGLSALYASTVGLQMPMPLLVGNSFETGGIIAATQINGGLIQVLKSSQSIRLQNLTASATQLIENDINRAIATRPSNASIDLYRSAIMQKNNYFSETINFYQSLELGDLPDIPAVNDIKFVLAGFAAGASIACDYSVNGFDTHDNHDKNMQQPLSTIAHAANAAWHFAEQLNIAHRLIVFISSEFGRTPFYNDVAGKDHWPFHSAIIMKKDAPWAQRIVGKTDDRLVGIPLNPNTLLPDPNGVLLDMNHIHQALRQYLSTSHTLNQKYPLEPGLVNNFLVG